MKAKLTEVDEVAGARAVHVMVCEAVLAGAPLSRASASLHRLEGVHRKVVQLLCSGQHEPPAHGAVFLCEDCLEQRMPHVPEEHLQEALSLSVGERVVFHLRMEA